MFRQCLITVQSINISLLNDTPIKTLNTNTWMNFLHWLYLVCIVTHHCWEENKEALCLEPFQTGTCKSLLLANFNICFPHIKYKGVHNSLSVSFESY